MENPMKKLSFVFTVAIALLMVSNPALAADGASDGGKGMIGLAAGLGGALGQGNTAKAALDAIGRNPNASVLVPMVLGLALIESLVIYGMVVAFQLIGKI